MSVSIDTKDVAKKASGAQNRQGKAAQDEEFEQSKKFMCMDKYIISKVHSSTEKTTTDFLSPSLDIAHNPNLIRGGDSTDDFISQALRSLEHENTTLSNEKQDLSDIGKWPQSLNQNTIDYIIEKGPVQISLDK
ncbi:hypothetical protein QAD02_007665 [Eretmocerus hayati]|uniref:Uncharacterized protein n=1 Tax=Eretmocerus hayati TaxID=131215 RepID=A0ACC2N5J9_9HYME|nr:hypothetical protein QAD02_007665 [Eretmocerus hayati]